MSLLTTTAMAQNSLLLNTTSAPPLANDSQSGFQDQLATNMFKLVNLEVDITRLPGERSLVNVDKGIDDATYARVGGLQDSYPSLLQIPEPMMSEEFVAFSKDSSIKITGWADLQPYTVAFINGWKIVEKNLSKHQQLTPVKDNEQLFSLLANDRIEVAIYVKWEGLHYIQQQGLEGIHSIEPALISPDMYMYVNKRHENLVSDLAEALKSMKDDGTYKKIYDATLGLFETQ